jgi:hypothetical protein
MHIRVYSMVPRSLYPQVAMVPDLEEVLGVFRHLDVKK